MKQNDRQQQQRQEQQAQNRKRKIQRQWGLDLMQNPP